MRAVVTDPQSAERFVLRDVPVPILLSNQALIKVSAFSLNQGETRTALDAAESYIPGWDFAGIIVQPAADGSTPKAGKRVFGYIARGSWAEYLAAPAGLMAEIPEEVSDVQAAAMPIAGLTAMACLDASGSIFNKRVLITGASGGVGRFACQLAALAGASVSAVSRRPELSEQLKQDGVKDVHVFTSVADAKAAGSYDLIWDSLGGESLATALTALSRNGVCINYGNSSRQLTSFDVRSTGWPFHGIQCIWLGREPIANSTPLFNRLAEMVKQGRLQVSIDDILPWSHINEAANKLVQQQVNGKIVLEVQ